MRYIPQEQAGDPGVVAMVGPRVAFSGKLDFQGKYFPASHQFTAEAGGSFIVG
jgi:hypothetical protein